MIISFDPGVTTGICAAFNVNYGLRTFEIRETLDLPWDRRFDIRYALGQIRKEEDQALISLDAIIVERFVLYASHASTMIGNDFPSVRIIGILEAYAELYGFRDRIVYQNAAATAKVQILPEHSRHFRGASEHTKDAYKHLRYYVVTKKRKPSRS